MGPQVSIIMPAYNAAAYLDAAIKGILAQTLTDFELIVVDDGSTDETPEILARFAAEDPRVRVITQENGGEGAARIAGFSAVEGAWLAHVDADDEVAPDFLERAVAAGESAMADVVVFRVESFDHETGDSQPLDFAFRHGFTDKSVFCPRDYADDVFVSYQNWLWNKLFRMSFIREQGISFADLRRSADVPFTMPALAAAERIALLDECLYRYRVNNAASAFATSDVDPLGFYEGFKLAQAFLKEKGLWTTYRASFVNWANYSLYSNLSVARSKEGFQTILSAFLDEGFELFEFARVPRRKFFRQVEYEFWRYLYEKRPSADALFDKFTLVDLNVDGLIDTVERVDMLHTVQV